MNKNAGHQSVYIAAGFILLVAAFLVSPLNVSPADGPEVLGVQTVSQQQGIMGRLGSFFESFFSFFSGGVPFALPRTAGTLGTSPHTDTIDIHAIPLGDGNVSASPKAGYVYACDTNFKGGGADHAGNWINGSTWDMTKKISVQGNVEWPTASFSTSVIGGKRFLTGNGLPVNTITGEFPISSSDPAYRYDRNPNSIKAQSVQYELPADPTIAVNPACVPMGAVGYALNGVAIYNALDDSGRDAVAHEVQDSCSGHPQSAGEYHYHGPSACMPNIDKDNALVGYALDGFGIYSMYDANGKEYTNSELDACHGITSNVLWDGRMVNMYHYVMTREYPYTIGCFRGTPVRVPHRGMRPPPRLR